MHKVRYIIDFSTSTKILVKVCFFIIVGCRNFKYPQNLHRIYLNFHCNIRVLLFRDSVSPCKQSNRISENKCSRVLIPEIRFQLLRSESQNFPRICSINKAGKFWGSLYNVIAAHRSGHNISGQWLLLISM